MRPGPSIASPTSAAGGPSSTSTPRTTRPAAPSRRASSAIANETIHERGADVWGVSPQGSASKRAFREKFELPFTLLADEDHAVADAYGSWVEKQNYGKTYWGVARTTFLIEPDGRIARVWAKVKPEGHAAEVISRARRAAGGARFVTLRAPSRGRTGDDERDGRRAEPSRPRLATGPVHGHRRAPGRRRVRSGRDGRPLDRRRVRGLAGVLHQRRPGWRGPRRRPARPGRPPREGAAGRRRRSSATPGSASCTSPTAPSPTTSPCASSSSARSGRSARTRSSPPTPRRSSTRAAGSTTPTIERPGIAAIDAVYPAARNPMAFPWLARSGLAVPQGPPGLPLLVGPERHLGRCLGHARAQDRGAPRARQPDPRSRRPRRADPVLGGRGGRADRGDRGRGARGS